MNLVVVRYSTADGKEPFTEWLTNVADQRARARILVRIERLELGNFGDAKALGEGIWELRIDKRKQDKDIERAIDLWHEYKERRSPKRRESR